MNCALFLSFIIFFSFSSAYFDLKFTNHFLGGWLVVDLRRITMKLGDICNNCCCWDFVKVAHDTEGAEGDEWADGAHSESKETSSEVKMFFPLKNKN